MVLSPSLPGDRAGRRDDSSRAESSSYAAREIGCKVKAGPGNRSGGLLLRTVPPVHKGLACVHVRTLVSRTARRTARGSQHRSHRERATVSAHIAAPLAAAFGNTCWWAVGPSLLALVPVSVIAMTQRRERDAPGARKLETAAT